MPQNLFDTYFSIYEAATSGSYAAAFLVVRVYRTEHVRNDASLKMRKSKVA